MRSNYFVSGLKFRNRERKKTPDTQQRTTEIELVILSLVFSSTCNSVGREQMTNNSFCWRATHMIRYSMISLHHDPTPIKTTAFLWSVAQERSAGFFFLFSRRVQNSSKTRVRATELSRSPTAPGSQVPGQRARSSRYRIVSV